ncbi:MAG TPA: Hpt domain-containing protein [Polyangiaceae bacterium]|nr:Hpt domain-containing protein [Polyangiaceae bacterium]
MNSPARCASVEVQPPSGPLPYDRSRLLSQLGGSLEILAEVAELFCLDAERKHAELRGYVLREDQHATGVAHQLKGVLLNVAADDAAATARELETLIRAGQWRAALAATDRLGAQLRELVEAFGQEPKRG